MLAAVWIIAARPAVGQIGGVFGPNSQFDLSDTVQLDRADSTVLAQLERVKAYLADHQWDEAVDTLQKVMENAEGKLLAVTEHRYVAVGDYCQLQFATLPPEALALYRSRVDPTARKWYTEGAARRDRKLLENVVQQAFASSWGDRALLDLGEMALESGDYAAGPLVLGADPAGGAAAGRGQDLARLSGHEARPGDGAGAAGVGVDPGRVRGAAREELAEFVRLAPGRARAVGRPRGQLCRGSASCWPRAPPGRSRPQARLAHLRRRGDAQQDCPAGHRRGRAGRRGLADAAVSRTALAEDHGPQRPGDSAKLLRYYPAAAGRAGFRQRPAGDRRRAALRRAAALGRRPSPRSSASRWKAWSATSTAPPTRWACRGSP